MARTVRRGLVLSLAQLIFLSGLGYGALGAAAGGWVTSGVECQGFMCIPSETVVTVLSVAALGGTLGVMAGRRAEAAVDRSDSVVHVWAVSLGAVLGGATVGLSAGALFVGDGENTVVSKLRSSTVTMARTEPLGYGGDHDIDEPDVEIGVAVPLAAASACCFACSARC
jgi:hypothetical protein